MWPLGGADGVPVLVSVEPPPGCFVETKSELKNEQCSKPWLVDDYLEYYGIILPNIRGVVDDNMELYYPLHPGNYRIPIDGFNASDPDVTFSLPSSLPSLEIGGTKTAGSVFLSTGSKRIWDCCSGICCWGRRKCKNSIGYLLRRGRACCPATDEVGRRDDKISLTSSEL